MPQPERFEVLVLGSGTGGKLIAWHLAQSGHRTAVVEQRWIGGSCLNIACTTVRRRKREMVERLIAAHLQKYKASGAELITGSGRFLAPKTLEVTERRRDTCAGSRQSLP